MILKFVSREEMRQLGPLWIFITKDLLTPIVYVTPPDGKHVATGSYDNPAEFGTVIVVDDQNGVAFRIRVNHPMATGGL